VLRRRGGGQVTEPRVSRQPSSFEVVTSAEDVRLALAMLHTLSRVGAGHDRAAAAALAVRLLGPEPGTCMTEAGEHGVDSVCQLLVLLCLSDDLDPLFTPHDVDHTDPTARQRRSRVAMALLAEAVSRSCRVLLRTAPPTPQHALDGFEARAGQSHAMLTARRLVRCACMCHKRLGATTTKPTHDSHPTTRTTAVGVPCACCPPRTHASRAIPSSLPPAEQARPRRHRRLLCVAASRRRD